MQVTVKVISRKGMSELIEWETEHGVRRAYLPSGMVIDGEEVDENDLLVGIPYGGVFLEKLLDSRFSGKANCIADTLEQAGMVTIIDLDNAPRKIGHICGEDIYQIVEVLTAPTTSDEDKEV